jgi:hypothetical protein
MFNKLSTTAVLLSSSSLLVSAFPHIAQLVAEQQKSKIRL